VASPLTVQVMERAESVAFLLRRTGQTDEAAAGQLAEALGDLPLPLAQAGAYVSQTGTTFPAYLELFQTRRTELWKRERPPVDYPDTVATTWDLAFRQVQRASPTGADLLNLCAFLAPDDIPQDLLRGGAQHLPEPLAEAVADPLKFDEAVAALLQYSLLERTGEALSVHRMVQAVARDRLADEARQTWVEAAARLVNDAFPFESEDVRTWPVCARLLPHALAAAGHAEALHVAPEATGYLFNQAGLYLWGRAEFAGAKAALERALAIFEEVLGADHPNVTTLVNNLAGVMYALGDLAGARAAFERALAIDEAAFGLDHPEVATDVNNLGLVLQDLGDLVGARAAYERALAIWEEQLGPEQPQVAIGVNNLGDVLRALGDGRGAESL
jgi:tetratricopeptide (TPR) repeat protein